MLQIVKIICAGALYLLFGFICTIGNIFFLPIIALNLQRFRAIQNLSRFLVRISWNFFLKSTEFLGYQHSNYQILKELSSPNTLIICNHPSLLDVVFFISQIKNVNCVVKKELKKNIFLYPAIKSSGYILNDDFILDKSIDVLKNGETLIIFPEGSRTKDEILMHKAAFFIAIKGAKKLIVTTLRMNPRSLKKGQKWYKTPKTKIGYNFKIEKEIELNEYERQKPDTLRVRSLFNEINEFYKKEFK